MQSSNFEESKEASLTDKQVEEFFENRTADCLDRVPLDKLFDISTLVSNKVPLYKHNGY